MGSFEDFRYTRLHLLSRAEERETWAGLDAWTGAPVVIKGGSVDHVRREAGILLAMPPGIAPGVRDIVWRGRGQFWFVLEHLRGRTLGEAAAELAPDRLPWLARALAQCLGHLHRAGYIHADLSPSNVVILDGPGEPVVRLLDFGFSRSRDLDEDVPQGGTPPFVAPEILRGWIVDGRADQYSLGVMLRGLFPWITADARWSPILDRLSRKSPGHRYPHILALRDELEQVFRLPLSESRWPPFGGGPMRGREELLADVTRVLSETESARVLLYTRRGLGLSRFLTEAALGVAAGDGPPLRVLDVGALLAEGCEGPELVGHLEGCTRSADTLLCGLPSPSRQLREFPPDVARGLRAIFSRPGWEVRALPVLDASAFTEIVAGSLESGGDLTESLASRLLTASDGDLRYSAELFRALVQQDGKETGPSWVVDLDQLQRHSQRGSPPTPQVDLTGLTPPELGALRLLARAGRAFPTRLAEDLLTHFGHPAILPDLLDSAFLVNECDGRLAFITRALWESTYAASLEGVDLIDRWLNEHDDPDPETPEAVLFAAHRARRLGDLPREAGFLANALTRARSTCSWGHVQALFAYPDAPPLRWSLDLAQQQVTALADLLAPAWSVGRLQVLAGASLVAGDRQAAGQLFSSAAESPEVATRTAALLDLAESRLRRRDGAAFARHLAELEGLAGQDGGPPPGLVDYLRGSELRIRGELAAAEEHLARAADLLRGAGWQYEIACLQLLAVLRFAHDPAAGIALLEGALQADPGREHEAQLRSNLAIMYSQIHDDEASLRCVEEGLRRLRGRVSRARLANLSIQRAWSLAESDRIEQAVSEATRLLHTPSVRTSLLLRTNVRLLVGFCHLHLGNPRTAVNESARALRDVLDARFAYAVSDSLLQLLDVLLDLRAWDTVREFGRELLCEPGDFAPLEPAAAARLRGFRAQLEGDPAAALAHLTGSLEAGRGATDATAAARYLHHTGLLHLADGHESAGAAAAAGFFEEELSLLGDRGRSYYRGCALMCLARAQAIDGQAAAAIATIDASISLAQKAGCRGLYVDALETRLQLRTEGRVP